MFFNNKRLCIQLLIITLTYSITISAQLSDWESGSVTIQDTDTLYVNKLLKKADELRSTYPDSAISIAERALQLSEELEYTRGKAVALKSLGLVEDIRNNYFQAEQYYKKSLELFAQNGDYSGISNIQSNLGSIYQTLGDDQTAEEYFKKSIANAQNANDPLRISTAVLNLGTVYSNDEKTFDLAIDNYKESLEIFDEIDYTLGSAVANINIGELLIIQDKPKEALPFLDIALNRFKEVGIDPATPLNYLGQAYLNLNDLENAEDYYQQALASASQMGTKSEEAGANLGLGDVSVQLENADKAITYYNAALKIAQESNNSQQTKDAYLGLSNAYALRSDYHNAFRTRLLYAEVSDSILLEQMHRQTAIQNQLKGLFKKDFENQRINFESQKKIDEQTRTLLYVGLGFLILIMAGLMNRFLFIRKAKNMISKEKDRSDEILLNILPEETAEELKANGRIKAKQFDQITVLFTDFKGFSVVAEEVSPEKLVDSVDYYFRHFDAIVEKYGLEKIKTIGDAYMCAGGLPIANETHAEDAMKAAIMIRDFVEQTKKNPPPNIHPFEIRIGLNSGPVVAGVVGTKKFAYDIWGSTVNFAARMESKSEPGRINVSETTFKLLKNKYDFTYRGEIEVKNGQTLKMYFAEVESPVTT